LRAVSWTEYPNDYRLTSTYHKARQRCIELIDGIIASIPYFLGWEKGPGGAFAGGRQSACGDQSFVIGVSAFYVMWPMFVAASSDFATPEQRAFVKGRLVYIAENVGVNQAYKLMKVCCNTSRKPIVSLTVLSQLLPLQHPSVYIMADRMTPMSPSIL